MPSKQKMLAFTIQGGGASDLMPFIGFGYPVNGATITPRTTRADLPPEFYWVCILDAYRPGQRLTDFVFPGSSNSTVPRGMDDAMSDPGIIFVVATKSLSLQHVPTGDWLNFLIKYGAGRELQRLNQLSTTLSPGVFNSAGYVLTGMGGPRGGSSISPPSYELGTITQAATIVALSWMSTASGEPPYSLTDSYTVDVRMKGAKAKAKTTKLKSKSKTSKSTGSKSKR